MRSDQLWVSELFGPTVQGEGPTAGQIRYFLRLAGCNLDCSWCDTKFTWDWANYDRVAETSWRPIGEVADWAVGKPLVVTGGEPMLQARNLATVLGAASYTEIETNGTISPRFLAVLPDQLNVSPKLNRFTSRDGLDYAVLAEYAALDGSVSVVWKFVASTAEDLTEIDRAVSTLKLPSGRVWVMPEGARRADWLISLERLCDPIIERGWNIGARLHVLAWDDERGR